MALLLVRASHLPVLVGRHAVMHVLLLLLLLLLRCCGRSVGKHAA